MTTNNINAVWFLGRTTTTAGEDLWKGYAYAGARSIPITSASALDSSLAELVDGKRLVFATSCGLLARRIRARLRGSLFDLELASKIIIRHRSRTPTHVLARVLRSHNKEALSVNDSLRHIRGERAVPDPHLRTLARMTNLLRRRLRSLGELDRYVTIEMPVRRCLWREECKAIQINDSFLKSSSGRQVRTEEVRAESIKNLGFDATELLTSTHRRRQHLAQFFGEEAAERSSGNALYALLKEHSSSDQGVERIYELISRLKNGSFLSEIWALRNDATYPDYDTIGTVTGRILLKYPGLQWAKKSDRPAIKAASNKTIHYFDYRCFEPSILAAASLDPNLMKDCEDDLYARAANILGFSGPARSEGKRVILCLLYGMQPRKISASLAKALSLEESEAAARLRCLTLRYEQALNFKNRLEDDATRTGVVTAIRGVIRPIRANQKHLALNHFLQASGALIFKKALSGVLSIDESIDLIAPMHDGMALSIPLDFEIKHLSLITSTMKNAFTELFPTATPIVTQTAWS